MINKSTLIRNYLKKFPNTPSLTIAKKIYAENSELFKDVENVRTLVRHIRGLHGTKARAVKAKDGGVDKDFIVPVGKFTNNPFKLPASDAKKPKVFTLPKKYDNVLLISDLHVPYHDITALSQAIKYGLEQKINCIFLNGDLLDFFAISRFVTLERKRSVAEELAIANKLLDKFNEIFPGVPIYFLLGNHDMRLQAYLAVKAPEVLDITEFRLEHLLRAKDHNMTIIPDTTLVKIGKLAVTHGHLLLRGIFAPVNPARGSFLKAKASVLVSHTHKFSTHSETTINGKIITCYSTGCLCELNPDYTPFANNYSHGFAHIRVFPNGNYSVSNKQIIDGQIFN